jgi:hypothetical protein
MEQMREGKHLNQQHIDGLRLHYNDLNLASLEMGMASWSYLDGPWFIHTNLHRQTQPLHRLW